MAIQCHAILEALVALAALSGAGLGHKVRPACPPEAHLCEFHLEIKQTLTMTTRPPGANKTMVLGVGTKGDIYQVTREERTPLNDFDLSKVPLGDGSYKNVYLYNGTLPGPPIIVYEGQQVVVRLRNGFRDMGTTLHFHGALQTNTPWMDGVAGVSQCDIMPGQHFTYRFLADHAGTNWYHSHYGTQRSMGAAGVYIVLEKDEAQVERRRTDSPLPKFDDDFYMIVQDWFRADTQDILLGITYDCVKYPFNYNTNICYNSTKQQDRLDSAVIPFVSVLINGRGRYMGHDIRYPEQTFIPFEVFKVHRGGYFRFRVVGASMMFPLQVSVDHHQLHLISTDGQHIRTQTTDTVIVFNGERYDFYIEATDQLRVGNYWIRVNTIEAMHNGKRMEPRGGKAILRYEGAPDREPTTTPRKCTKQNPCHTFNCPYTSEVSEVENTICHPVTDLVHSELHSVLEMEDDDVQEYFLNFHFTPPFGSAKNASSVEKPTINGVQHKLPVSSPMTFPEKVDNLAKHCYYTSCETGLCRECDHRLHLPVNKTIQLNLAVTVNNEPGVVNGNDHPIHIHGHSMQVLKIAYPNYHPKTKAYTTTNTDFSCTSPACNTLVWTNRSWDGGRVPGLLKERPPLKDSMVVPAGGYAVVRIRTDNPGYWYMHCHVEFHNAEGMGLIIKAGEESQMNAKPENLRSCSNFLWPNGSGSKVYATEEEEQICGNPDEAYKFAAMSLGVAALLLTGSFIYTGCSYKLNQVSAYQQGL